ncbi:hypothetical protein DFJ58DRAFT_738557 [Suillus subalutaceus]|uniref:uncharacterized protein n=1 Tax=Suillus subalutaceus TaxID=48586 RepID=UPI001B8662C4|nr:uncharacterized protein DFJ58DRAFT_738557 [Suillus subalutaceus]KAG1825231.1 hypothetical protein DFJ58DRAFT_738557 [Suillus subalutaceus]
MADVPSFNFDGVLMTCDASQNGADTDNVAPLPHFPFTLNSASQSDACQNGANIVVPSPHLPFSFNSASRMEPLRMGNFNTSSFNWTDHRSFIIHKGSMRTWTRIQTLSPTLPHPSEALDSNTNPSPTLLDPSNICSPSPAQGASETLPDNDDPNLTPVSFTDRMMDRGNNSSWAARNPTHPVIATRSNGGGRLTKAQKASHALKTAQNKEQSKALQEAITQFVQEQGKKLHDSALAHHVSDDHVKNLIGLETHYKKARELQLRNALVHAKSKEVNEGLVHSQKYTMAEIQKMVADDPNMPNLSREQKKDFIKQLMDYLMDGVLKECHALQDRTGIYATVLMVQGHVNDQIQSTWIVTDNASEFWEDWMEVALDDMARQFEEWACIQKKRNHAWT